MDIRECLSDNLRHLAPRAMAVEGVRLMAPGLFLNEVWASNPTATFRAVLRSVEDLRQPPYTLEELLRVLAGQKATALVRGVAQRMGIAHQFGEGA